jgi:hypothetical protein
MVSTWVSWWTAFSVRANVVSARGALNSCRMIAFE